jgi:hypothetical protein
MIICAAGDSHGAIDRLFSGILDFERSLGVCFEVVLHVGDFGIWPDASRIDRATRNHDGAGDFPTWFAENRHAPRRTIFIKRNHEDFVWLDEQPDGEVLPGLFYLKNGRRMTVESEGRTMAGSVVVSVLRILGAIRLLSKDMPIVTIPERRSIHSSRVGVSMCCWCMMRRPG